MKRFSIAIALVGGMWFAAPVPMAGAAPCLVVTLTGTQSGPSVFNGQAGAGTLVRYGDDSNDCAAMMLRWYFKGPKIDIVCSSDATSVLGVTNSCRKYVTHIADAFLQSGEIAER